MSKFTEEQIENGKRWIAALRSGEFEQAHGNLHIGDSHCCLGVAQIILDNVVEPEEDYVDDVTKAKMGLDQKATAHCVALNDGAYSSDEGGFVEFVGFSRIADWLERDFYGLGEPA